MSFSIWKTVKLLLATLVYSFQCTNRDICFKRDNTSLVKLIEMEMEFVTNLLLYLLKCWLCSLLLAFEKDLLESPWTHGKNLTVFSSFQFQWLFPVKKTLTC